MGFIVILVIVGLVGAFIGRAVIYDETARLTMEEKAALTTARNLNPGAVALFSLILLSGVYALHIQLAFLGVFIFVIFVFAFAWETHILRKAGLPRRYIKTYITVLATLFFGLGGAVAIYVALVT